jgi:lysophospholipase L1-like esterase
VQVKVKYMKRFISISFLILAGCGDNGSQLKTVFLAGDSLSAPRKGVYQYGEQLKDRLEASFTVVMKGIRGNTVTDLYGRVETDIIQPNPDAVVIMVGINDVNLLCLDNTGALGSYRADYERLLDKLKEFSPNTTVILIAPFVLNKAGVDYESDDLVPQLSCVLSEMPLFNKVVRDLAAERNLVVLDSQSLLDTALIFNDLSALTPDGYHLTTLGNKILADALEPYIRAVQ